MDHTLLARLFQYGLGYAIQVTSPKIIKKELDIHDLNINKYRDVILSKLSTGNKPKCSELIQSNADRKARLPSRFGGLGHTSATLIAPIAFYSSHAHHLKLDKPNTEHLLAPEINFCLEYIRGKIPKS